MELTEVSMGDAGDATGADAVADDPDCRTAEPSRPTAVCIHTGPVCVTIIDWTPAPAPAGGVCRCGACHGSYHADSAAWFY
jgi:hypothetical protein